MSFWAKIWKKIDIYHFFKGKKSTKHAILSYFSVTFQLHFPHSLRVFLKNVKCCFGFLFEKMSKLRGVENAHTWPHMVRLTQRSTSKIFASFSSVRCTKRLMSAKFSLEAAQCSRLSQRSVWQRKNSRATPTPPRSCKFSAQKFANSLQIFCVCEFMAIGLTWAFWFITFSVYFFGRWIIFGEDLMYFMSLFEKRKENWPTSTQKLINFKAHKMRSPGFTEYA